MATALENVRTCPVCYTSYNDNVNKPLMLPCGHPVCSFCVNALQDNENKACPICRVSLEDYDASNLIVCFTLIMDENLTIKCLIHDFEIIFWCTECHKMICKKCVTDAHSNCRIRVLEDAADDMKEYLVATSTNLSAKLTRLEGDLSKEMKTTDENLANAQCLMNIGRQMTIMLTKKKNDLAMTETQIQATKSYTQKVLNEVFDADFHSSTKDHLKMREIFKYLDFSYDISVPKDESKRPLLDIISKQKVQCIE